jgi:hypothetical protein
VQLGAEFQYTFDLGDEGVHRCTVGGEKGRPGRGTRCSAGRAGGVRGLGRGSGPVRAPVGR